MSRRYHRARSQVPFFFFFFYFFLPFRFTLQVLIRPFILYCAALNTQMALAIIFTFLELRQRQKVIGKTQRQFSTYGIVSAALDLYCSRSAVQDNQKLLKRRRRMAERRLARTLRSPMGAIGHVPLRDPNNVLTSKELGQVREEKHSGSTSCVLRARGGKSK